jgi:hypothetical protein
LLKNVTLPSKNSINANAVAMYLADAYLTMKNYEQAISYAQKAREGYPLMTIEQYKQGFNSIDNPEWIWGCVITAENTNYYATWFSHMAHFMTDGVTMAFGYGGSYAPKAIYSGLYDAIPVGDVRKELYVSAGPEKYIQKKFLWPDGFLGDLLYTRAAEAYLIEAEASVHINETQARQVLYDLVSTRYPGYQLSTNTGQALIDEILLQKRIELWGEGRAQFDLKRLKLGVDRTGDNNHRDDAKLVFEWNHKTFVFAMPMTEIEANPNLELDENQ